VGSQLCLQTVQDASERARSSAAIEQASGLADDTHHALLS
jgi:hypothetical protein